MLPKERDERPARGSLMKSNNELPGVLTCRAAPAAVAVSAKATPFAFSAAGSSFRKGVSSVSCGTGT